MKQNIDQLKRRNRQTHDRNQIFEQFFPDFQKMKCDFNRDIKGK